MIYELDFGHFARKQIAGKWQADEGCVERCWRLWNFVMPASSPDFTSFLRSAGLHLPDLQGFHSQMAKVEWNFLRKTTWPEFQPSLPRGLVDLRPKPFDLGSLG
jgi:hypothetical protein